MWHLSSSELLERAEQAIERSRELIERSREGVARLDAPPPEGPVRGRRRRA